MPVITLPLHPENTFSWIEEKQQASNTVQKGELIFWQFDLGLESPYFPLDEELIFQALCLGLAHFTKELWPLFEKHTEGASFYKGSPDFSSFFYWSAKQEENWTKWIESQHQGTEIQLRRLFCADAFAYYFQMLSYHLPDDLPLTLHFNCSIDCSLAETIQLLSKNRFPHFLLKTEGLPVSDTAKLAVCFPEDSCCSSDVLDHLNFLFSQLKTPYKVIFELFLTESWDGIDFIYVFSKSLHSLGKRKLMGFCAAGGIVISEGAKIGVSKEVSVEEFGAEGFEPPAYWSQTSRASQAALCPDEIVHYNIPR